MTSTTSTSVGLPASGAAVLGVVGGRPKIADAPNLKRTIPSLWQRVRRADQLLRAEVLASPADPPCWACTACGATLPDDIDRRSIHTIAVAGVNGASKAHFLTSMLTEAARHQGFQTAFGCSEFAPYEASAPVFNELSLRFSCPSRPTASN